MAQDALMKYDPATGAPEPYPSHAEQWRIYHGLKTAWLFNPWTGLRRNAKDVGLDMLGRNISPGSSLYTATPAQQPPKPT